VLRLNREVFDAIRAHGEETYPHECCGALLGRATANGWWIETSVKGGQYAHGFRAHRYQISPAELVKIERESRQRGLSIAGFITLIPTIPRSGRRPILPRRTGWCSYVITAVAQGNATETNAFLLAGDARRASASRQSQSNCKSNEVSRTEGRIN